MKIPLFLLLVFCTLFLSVSVRGQDTLPTAWQSNMRLISTSCCGMLPGYDSLVISLEKSYYVNTHGKKFIRKVYHFSHAQLNDLLVVLRQKHFGTVVCETGTVLVLDKESSSFQLIWSDHVLADCVSDPEKLTPAQHQDLSDIFSHIDKLTGNR